MKRDAWLGMWGSLEYYFGATNSTMNGELQVLYRCERLLNTMIDFNGYQKQIKILSSRATFSNKNERCQTRYLMIQHICAENFQAGYTIPS